MRLDLVPRGVETFVCQERRYEISFGKDPVGGTRGGIADHRSKSGERRGTPASAPYFGSPINLTVGTSFEGN
jgi:hypothetical protein